MERRSSSASVCSAMDARTSSRFLAFFMEVGIGMESSFSEDIAVTDVRGADVVGRADADDDHGDDNAANVARRCR